MVLPEVTHTQKKNPLQATKFRALEDICYQGEQRCVMDSWPMLEFLQRKEILPNERDRSMVSNKVE